MSTKPFDFRLNGDDNDFVLAIFLRTVVGDKSPSCLRRLSPLSSTSDDPKLLVLHRRQWFRQLVFFFDRSAIVVCQEFSSRRREQILKILKNVNSSSPSTTLRAALDGGRRFLWNNKQTTITTKDNNEMSSKCKEMWKFRKSKTANTKPATNIRKLIQNRIQKQKCGEQLNIMNDIFVKVAKYYLA
uniref:Uncharacterized protein n=1 Tax=Romanomermis culicivorax TaxID=13658 RepID=A0A915L9U6_ROMCU